MDTTICIPIRRQIRQCFQRCEKSALPRELILFVLPRDGLDTMIAPGERAMLNLVISGLLYPMDRKCQNTVLGIPGGLGKKVPAGIFRIRWIPFMKITITNRSKASRGILKNLIFLLFPMLKLCNA